jgi:hypothetical protein
MKMNETYAACLYSATASGFTRCTERGCKVRYSSTTKVTALTLKPVHILASPNEARVLQDLDFAFLLRLFTAVQDRLTCAYEYIAHHALGEHGPTCTVLEMPRWAPARDADEARRCLVTEASVESMVESARYEVEGRRDAELRPRMRERRLEPGHFGP